MIVLSGTPVPLTRRLADLEDVDGLGSTAIVTCLLPDAEVGEPLIQEDVDVKIVQAVLDVTVKVFCSPEALKFKAVGDTDKAAFTVFGLIPITAN